MKYCIIMKADNSKIEPALIPSKDSYTFIALVDRFKFKDQWWTDKLDFIKRFDNKEDAEKHCSAFKFGNPKVVTEDEMIRRCTHWFKRVFSKSDTLHDMLMLKASQWTDDDWYEGIND